MARRIDSAILWQGPSRIDGAPIIAVITGLRRPSKNEKTGPMAQVFILRADMSPLEAIARGLDVSICGGCRHRGTATIAFGQAQYSDRSCYVVVAQSPTAVYRAYKHGSYPVPAPEDLAPLLAGMSVRLGAYGDPAAVPVEVWQALIPYATKHTGYTHQWTRADSQAYRAIVMASVDTPAEYARAQGLGWRTFRVRTADQGLTPNEVMCPASEEMQYRTDCDHCGLCAGTARPAKSIAILVHGAGSANFVSLSSLKRN